MSEDQTRGPSRWIYVVAAPVIAVMGLSLLRDPRRLGDPVELAGDLRAVTIIAALVSAILVGVWALSKFPFRTQVLLVQIAVIWVGGLLFAFEVRMTVSMWDVAEDAVLLLTTMAQLTPGARRHVA